MKSLPRLVLAAAAALAVAALPAVTRADQYIALKGGVWVPTAGAAYESIAGAVQSGTLPPSGDVELAYGATLGILGVQLAGGYMWSSTTDAAGATVKASTVPFYGLLQLRLPIFFIQPYLEAGIGGLANFASSGSQSGTKVSFLAIGGGGVDFMLGPILLGAEARYMYATEQSFDWGNMKLSGVNVTANVGYRW